MGPDSRVSNQANSTSSWKDKDLLSFQIVAENLSQYFSRFLHMACLLDTNILYMVHKYHLFLIFFRD